MKAVIQRVTNASVSGLARTSLLKHNFLVNGEVISTIGKGLCVLVGMKADDNGTDIDYIVKKILNLKLFESYDGKRWCTSVKDNGYEVLCISQFTLYHILKGNKPNFYKAMPAQESEPFYNRFLEQLRRKHKPELIKDGKFGAMMEVSIQNSGPVTLEIESPLREQASDTREETQNLE